MADTTSTATTASTATPAPAATTGLDTATLLAALIPSLTTQQTATPTPTPTAASAIPSWVWLAGVALVAWLVVK